MDNSGVSFNRTAKSPLTTFFDFGCSLNLLLYLLSFKTHTHTQCFYIVFEGSETGPCVRLSRITAGHEKGGIKKK